MASQEPSECRGGLLLDEMGMGKTLSILALIIHSIQQAKNFGKDLQSSNHQSLALCRSRATLIVTPKSSLCIPKSFIEEMGPDLNVSYTRMAAGGR